MTMMALWYMALCLVAAVYGDEEDLDKPLSYSEFPKADDESAPLYMQKSTKSTNMLDLFFSKYGMTGEKKIKKSKRIESSPKDSDSSGWVYAVVTSGTTCHGEEYMTGAIKLETCIAMDSSASAYMTCSDGDINYYLYDSEDCSGDATTSSTLATTGCSESSWFTTSDDDGATNSIKIQCSTTALPPYQTTEVDYDVLKLYASSSDSTCPTSEFIAYEAYPIDTCVAISYSSYTEYAKKTTKKFSSEKNAKKHFQGLSGRYSVKFHATAADVPYMSYYTETDDCTGSASSYSLTTTCESCYTGYDIYYKWSYYEYS